VWVQWPGAFKCIIRVLFAFRRIRKTRRFWLFSSSLYIMYIVLVYINFFTLSIFINRSLCPPTAAVCSARFLGRLGVAAPKVVLTYYCSHVVYRLENSALHLCLGVTTTLCVYRAKTCRRANQCYRSIFARFTYTITLSEFEIRTFFFNRIYYQLRLK